LSSVRLSVGDRSSFVARLLALSALVALMVGSFALRDVVTSAIPSGVSAGVGELSSAVLGEVDALIAAWLVPVWLLVAAASFVVALDAARAFGDTTRVLGQLGGDVSHTRSLILLRSALLVSLSLLVGLSLGLVASQVVFRAFVVVLGAQYYVPVITPASLALVSALVLSALVAGTAAGALVSGRGRR
jgi:hypothetical protein